jgi:PrtD family type I secretion system ABC transporter
VINILALTGSFYMLQVYDRVIPSHSIPTLIGLSVLMVGLYTFNGVFELIRTRVLSRIGLRFDKALRLRVFDAMLLLPIRAGAKGEALQPVRDLDQIRNFLASAGPTALFDMPWMPLYLGMTYLLHPWLGLVATAGAVILVALAVLTEVRGREPTQSANKSATAVNVFGEASRRNVEAAQAMGLGPQLGVMWTRLNARHQRDQLAAGDLVGGIATISRVIRLVLQSGMLGLGAYLTVAGEATGGVMIASSILTSRALAPIEIAIANWRGFLGAQQSYDRLGKLLGGLAAEQHKMPLPAPKRSLSVEALAVAAPGQPKPILRGVTFALEAGQGLGIIGPSASGKSTLARALVGVWLPIPMTGGLVRIDGAALDQLSSADLGPHIGYLPQDIELFEGTVAENIARFRADATGDAIIAAARAAGLHDLILHLPQGYDTRIGEGGAALSAGQRQRIALARALFGDPFLVVLDEPNSNLDSAGDSALTEAISSVRARGGIVIVIAHRPSALVGLDLLLAMANGQQVGFGPKDEILRKVLNNVSPGANPSQPPSSAPQQTRGHPVLRLAGDKSGHGV